MTKARTKAARRRARSNLITLHGGQQVEARRAQGQRKPPAEPAEVVALEARLRRAGLDPTPENVALVKAPWLGCAVGRAIFAHCDHDQDRTRLWGAVCHMRRVVVAMDRAIGAPNRHAQCLRILAPAEMMHADAESPPPDDRSPDDKHRQAVDAYMRLQGWLGYVDKAAMGACIRHVVDEPDEPICDWPGILAALECVAEGMRGDTPTYRGRS